MNNSNIYTRKPSFTLTANIRLTPKFSWTYLSSIPWMGLWCVGRTHEWSIKREIRWYEDLRWSMDVRPHGVNTATSVFVSYSPQQLKTFNPLTIQSWSIFSNLFKYWENVPVLAAAVISCALIEAPGKHEERLLLTYTLCKNVLRQFPSWRCLTRSEYAAISPCPAITGVNTS